MKNGSSHSICKALNRLTGTLPSEIGLAQELEVFDIRKSLNYFFEFVKLEYPLQTKTFVCKNLVVQKKYISKIFKDTYLKKFDFKRIDMKVGEVLIFHPNLLHGGSKNIGNKTRVSFDFRIFNKNLS